MNKNDGKELLELLKTEKKADSIYKSQWPANLLSYCVRPPIAGWDFLTTPYGANGMNSRIDSLKLIALHNEGNKHCIEKRKAHHNRSN